MQLCQGLSSSTKSKLSKRQRNFSTEPAQKRMKMDSPKPGIMDLPDEVLETIFLMLPQHDAQQGVALACKRFLNITRRPNFVQTVEVEPFVELKPYWKLPQCNFPESCLKKIEKVKKVYPNCKIELACDELILESILMVPSEDENEDEEDDYDYDEHEAYEEHLGKPYLSGFSWMKEFLPYATSITKLTLAVTVKSAADFKDFIVLENLECLELDLYEKNPSELSIPKILKNGSKFWSKFPNLKSLIIKSNHSWSCVSTFLV